MTAEEFVHWAMRQETGRYELVDGIVVRMNSERLVHVRVKHRLAVLLDKAIATTAIEAEMMADGMAVRVSESTVHEPDALVRCGPPLDDETIIITDPIVVCEVLSPSTGPVDTGTKLLNYFSIASVQHYLVVDTTKRTVLHYRRGPDGSPALQAVSAGELHLDPPGLTIAIADLFS